MATLAQISTAIKSKWVGVVGGSVPVHDYERYRKNNADFAGAYKNAATSRLHGYNFYREATREEDIDVGSVRRLHIWRWNGFMAIDDADNSQKLLQDELELIASAFRLDRTLGGVVLDLKDMDQERGLSGLQVERIEPVMFAGVLCFRATGRLLTDTQENAV